MKEKRKWDKIIIEGREQQENFIYKFEGQELPCPHSSRILRFRIYLIA